MNRLRTAFSIAAAVLSAFLLVGNLSSFIHLSTTEHSYCLEHGQVVDVDDGRHASSRPPLAEPTPGYLATLDSDAGFHDEGHEHCLHANSVNPRFLKGPALGQESPQPLAHKQCFSRRDLPFFATSTLLRLAPKQSPPTVFFLS